MTREEWLLSLAHLLAPDFAKIGAPLAIDLVRVSVGFPSRRGLSARNRIVGQCWSTAASEKGHHEIFVNPTVGSGLEAAAILTHELVHSAVGVEAGHKGAFRKAALAIGLEGKMTATVPGPSLTECLNVLVAQLGEYPHAALNPKLSGLKKQDTRLLKAQCPKCGYVVRVTRQWADMGLPTCSCGAVMVLA
ncbi:MAG TPA: hypothetical protein VNX28_16180 [Gemmataceae bacterium]|jgi:hypothetical protein|nr:hypothetical protein [Gemmataceae bacterium]